MQRKGDSIKPYIKDDSGKEGWRIIGDPTEGALVVAAAKGGYTHDEANAMCPRVQEIPFDSERKRMSTLLDKLAGFTVYPSETNFVLVHYAKAKELNGAVID